MTTRLLLAALLLLTLATTAAAITPANLELVGGYKLTSFADGGRTMAFTNGGLTGKREGDTLRLWMTHHATNGGKIVEFTAPATLSTDATISKWPAASFVRLIPAYAELNAQQSGLIRPSGLHWSAERNRLLVSGRNLYSTGTQPTKWLVEVEVGATPVVHPAISPGLDIAAFGGDFVRIPQAFADAYTGGNTIGIGKGGYASGQGSATSPTLAAWGNAPAKVLQWSQWNAPAEQRERRDPDYNSGTVGWQPQPVDGVGFWGTDSVRATCWIETPEASALLVWVRQATGTLDYSLQNETFSTAPKTTLYVYDPADLAKVAKGELKPHEVRGKWYPWASPGGSPCGAWWDYDKQQLHIVNKWAYKTYPSDTEAMPAIAVYQVVGIEPTPEPEPEPTPTPEPEPEPSDAKRYRLVIDLSIEELN